ncbi:hypothetical protein OROMI_016467 [Orobanche minor]
MLGIRQSLDRQRSRPLSDNGRKPLLKRFFGLVIIYNVFRAIDNSIKDVCSRKDTSTPVLSCISDELKIAGGISFSFAAPTFMVPKILPRDPGQHLEGGTEKGAIKMPLYKPIEMP